MHTLPRFCLRGPAQEVCAGLVSYQGLTASLFASDSTIQERWAARKGRGENGGGGGGEGGGGGGGGGGQGNGGAEREGNIAPPQCLHPLVPLCSLTITITIIIRHSTQRQQDSPWSAPQIPVSLPLHLSPFTLFLSCFSSVLALPPRSHCRILPPPTPVPLVSFHPLR